MMKMLLFSLNASQVKSSKIQTIIHSVQMQTVGFNVFVFSAFMCFIFLMLSQLSVTFYLLLLLLTMMPANKINLKI